MAWAPKKMSGLGATLNLFSKSKSICPSVLPVTKLGLSGAPHGSNSEEDTRNCTSEQHVAGAPHATTPRS